MPRVGSKSSIAFEPFGQPAGDGHLLLVAAGQPPYLAARPGRRSTGAGRRRRCGGARSAVDGSPLGDAVEQRRGDVLPYRPLGSRAWRRSLGTSTTPRRMVSKGWSAAGAGRPRRPRSPWSARRLPDSTSNSRSWPCPSRATRPSTSPARHRQRHIFAAGARRQRRISTTGRAGGDLHAPAARARASSRTSRGRLAQHRRTIWASPPVTRDEARPRCGRRATRCTCRSAHEPRPNGGR